MKTLVINLCGCALTWLFGSLLFSRLVESVTELLVQLNDEVQTETGCIAEVVFLVLSILQIPNIP